MRVKAGDRAGYHSKDGYRAIKIDGRGYPEHQLAWFFVHARWGVPMIDHINGCHSDNRIANLREVTNAINMQNQRRARVDNQCGALGVKKHPRADRWLARIKCDGKLIHLGSFATKDEAHEAYVEAKRRLHSGCTI